jgi:glycosyltransferase involved in cell wall biosynthesis
MVASVPVESIHQNRGTKPAPRVGFVTEQALGHVTYARNLQSVWDTDGVLSPVWLPIPYSGGPLDRVPGIGRNWTLRGSTRAQLALRHAGGAAVFDALFFHTQTVALFSSLQARRLPVVVSLDATPLNFDAVGQPYGHMVRPNSTAERAKRAIYRRIFQDAAALTTWSQWAKDSLRDDYDVDPDRVTVIHPGINLDLFAFGASSTLKRGSGPVRILFVGGDFVRKGGNLLLKSMTSGLAGVCELDIVTSAAVPPTPGVRVHRDLGPNDPQLLALFRTADIFALPTYADCLAVVLGEAMASGLPIITTAVGAHAEVVRDGHNGIIVPPGDVNALGTALSRLAADPSLRNQMGHVGRLLAEERFDARVNAQRVARVVLEGIEHWRERGRHCADAA